jgi:ATP-binding cassette subfamily A (ABC1) protein 3
VDVTSYWLATFAWDLINALVPILISFLLFAAFQIDGFKDEALGAILLLLFLTCWATIPIVYCTSFLFSNSLVAFGLIVLGLFFSSQVFLVVTLVVTDRDVVDGLHYLFLLDPAYNLAAALNDLYTNNIVREACTASELNQMVCDNDDMFRYVDDVFATERPGIGVNIVYLLLEGVFFFILTLLIEYKFFIPELRGLCLNNGNSNDHEDSVPLPGEDDDVIAERKKITTGATTEDDVVIIKDMVKEYRRRLDGCSIRPSKLAVQRINLTIPRSECFGLLGVNGAGKTTTFSMLTGDIAPTSGTAIVSGFDIRTDLRKVQQRVGYCPQFDALIERMTGRELLTMFARLRGIPEPLISQAVEAEVARLDLSKHAGKQCGKYSGGNKRKLSTALALVGNPPIIFLDEPTTGMDPATRRYLWDVLIAVTKEGRSIVLTSHSMEECEALCTRLAIMVNGHFKCLGGIQHLKSKYGSGFYLQAKVKLDKPPPDFDVVPTFRSSIRRSLRRQFSRQSSNPKSPGPKSPGPLEGGGPPEGGRGLRMFSRQSSNLKSPGPTEGGRHTEGGRAGKFSAFSDTRRSKSAMSFQSVPRETFNHLFGTVAVDQFILEQFAGAVKLEEHQGSVTYQLPGAGLSWSAMFRQLETHKERLGIVDYSISQTTLEQVFINFAKEQAEEDI